MRLKKKLITHQIDDDYITIFTSEKADEFHGMMRSNATAKFILECLNEETSREDILKTMMEKYDGKPEEMQEDIEKVLIELRKTGMLLEDN